MSEIDLKEFLKQMIPEYLEDMMGLSLAFAHSYHMEIPTEIPFYDFTWFDDWHYNFANEQYELMEQNSPHEDYDKLIPYKNSKWDVYSHAPHWLFESSEGIKVEVCHYDTRLIDTGFLIIYICSKHKQKASLYELSYQNVSIVLDELAQEYFLKQVKLPHGGVDYRLNSAN